MSISVVSCWEDEIETYDCGEEVSRWLSEFLKRPNMRLLYTAPHLGKRRVRDSSKKYVYKARPDDMVCIASS